jgi:hypothetical protein
VTVACRWVDKAAGVQLTVQEVQLITELAPLGGALGRAEQPLLQLGAGGRQLEGQRALTVGRLERGREGRGGVDAGRAGAVLRRLLLLRRLEHLLY